MIKFFRKIRQNLISGGKTGKYLKYAVGEIILVVIGILIALQLNNVNENRKTMAQAKIWRADIIEDLRSTQRSLEWRIDYYKQALVFAETTLPALMTQEPLTADQGWHIVLGAFQAGQIMPFRVSGPTYREVQAAGALYSIGSQDAMTGLANYYEVTANDVEVISGGSPPYRDMIREKMPWALQHYIWSSDCQRQMYNDGDGGFVFTLEYCEKPDLDEEIENAVIRFRSDIDLQDKLRGRMSQLTIVIASFQRNVESIENIITNLNKSQTTNQ
ncbi:hypothetical protein C1T31_12665 [Hanstruepera neustonica]|uniref:Uncharacterized protein n=1 Tax=Hanstruepera neustonica TaxID=1445657 RepID=A0A2K1DVY4_9FLAO|nr:hypothetical protein [Hanstruepera neustonica]PNQ72173.1 hypothetical protein C1T31_12665 [Hanstruepera neustonica]